MESRLKNAFETLVFNDDETLPLAPPTNKITNKKEAADVYIQIVTKLIKNGIKNEGEKMMGKYFFLLKLMTLSVG